MFITVVKPHYRLDTKGRFYLVTRRGEFVFAGIILGLAAREEAGQAGRPEQAQDGQGDIKQDQIAVRAGLEAGIQGLRHKLERKPINHNTRRALRAVGA